MKTKLLATIIFFAFLMTISSLARAEIFRPQSIPDLEKTSVKILNLKESGGGTGSIFRSYRTGSHILTNKHVCRLIEQGGVVAQKDQRYLITHYKKFPSHDLCLVRIAKNLKINLAVSDRLTKQSSTVYVSGHPNLLPHIATKGHLSADRDIQLVVGVRDCKEEDYKENAMYCMFFGGYPIIKTFRSTVVSNLIMPGSSGSAIFDTKGEIVGVIYAGDGRSLSFGYAVPHIHLMYFLKNAQYFDWVKVGTKVDSKGMRDRIFNYGKCKTGLAPLKLHNFCQTIEDNMVWRKQ